MNRRSFAPVLVVAAIVATMIIADSGPTGTHHRRSTAEVMTAEIKPQSPPGGTTVTVPVAGRDGRELGEVTLLAVGQGVAITARFRGLEPGFKGLDIHEVGTCDADGPGGAFASAGGVYSGDDDRAPAGRLPALLVLDDGTAELTVVTDRFTLDELTQDRTAAVIVHGTRGGSTTDRIACGVIDTPDRAVEDDLDEV